MEASASPRNGLYYLSEAMSSGVKSAGGLDARAALLAGAPAPLLLSAGEVERGTSPVKGPRASMGEASAGRLLIVVPSLAAGGAERMVVNLCRALDRRLWQPIVVTFTPENDFADEMPPDVPHLVLGKAGRLGNAKLVHRLARLFRQQRPDLAFSRVHFATSIALMARALSRRAMPLVAAVDTTLSISLRHECFGWVRKAFTRLFFPKVDPPRSAP